MRPKLKIPTMKDSCLVCGQTGHGYHFGVMSCRACSAFFRRYANTDLIKKSCKKNIDNFESCFCRPCRLKICIKVGMKTDNFQYHRDPIAPLYVPKSIEQFSGKPEFLMYRQSISSEFSSFIDLHNLISEASRILNFGCESPIFAGTQLKKLSLGSKYLKLNTKNMKVFDRFGKIEFMDTIEFYFLSVIKWITYFDEFRKLDAKDQMKLLFSIWHVWMKFQKCCVTATFRKTNSNPDEHILRNSVWDIKKARMDCTWISDYPKEYVALYMQSQNIYEYEIMEEFVKLNSTDTELTFMFAQTCFEYAGKRFQGEILKITDGFQEVLSNDLHNYYVNERRNPRYIGRLRDLMKLNNLVQKSIWESRPQRELSKVFDVIKVRYSHPEMFEDSEFN